MSFSKQYFSSYQIKWQKNQFCEITFVIQTLAFLFHRKYRKPLIMLLEILSSLHGQLRVTLTLYHWTHCQQTKVSMFFAAFKFGIIFSSFLMWSCSGTFFPYSSVSSTFRICWDKYVASSGFLQVLLDILEHLQYSFQQPHYLFSIFSLQTK